MLTERDLLDIRLLGGVEVYLNGAPLPPLHSRRGLWLLALLALRAGKPVPRVKLAGLLWLDSDESTALQNLRQTLANLRRALGPLGGAVVADAGRALRLDLARARVDLLAYDAACSDGSSASLEQAVELYSGPLLEGCDEAWAIEERQPRAEAYLSALERLAIERAGGGDHARAASLLRRAVTEDPFRESVRRALMQSLAQLGEITAAQEVYRDLRALLHRELNAQPDPATTRLYHAIRYQPALSGLRSVNRSGGDRDRPPAPASRQSQLPVPLTELVGREDEIHQVSALLAGSRLVTLTGTGGVGKTRLALGVAASLEASLEAGATFVDLTAISDPALLPAVALQALELSQRREGPDEVDVLRAYLMPREMLLVLDNCERLVAECASLAERLLSRCPRLRVLATSRQALGLRGEVLYRVPSLGLPPAGWPQAPARSPDADLDLLVFPAVKLFVERARASGAWLRLDTGTIEPVVAICRRLDGIPLAIELAAARVRSLSLRETWERLSRGLGLLQGGEAWGIERHRTLRTVFDWGWNLLTPHEQSALAALSVFPGDWTLEAARAVLVTPDSNTVRLVSSLVDKSLVVYVRSSEGEAAEGSTDHAGRYRLLETVRQFAEERVVAAGQRQAVMDRHRDYYMTWTDEHRPALGGPNSAPWFDRFEAEHGNLRAAIDWCRHQGEIQREFRLLKALGRFWDTHGHLREGRAYQESGLSRLSPDVPPQLAEGVATAAGWAAMEQGDWAGARSACLLALDLNRASGDDARWGGILNFLACIAFREGKIEEAQSLFEEALSLERASGQPGPLASVLNNLAELEILSGDLSGAEARLCEAAPICEESGRTQLLGIVYGNLSAIALRQGRFGAAEARCRKGICCLRDAGALVNMPDALRRMGVVSMGLGAPQRAEILIGAADALAVDLGVPLRVEGAAEIDAALAAARAALGEEGFENQLERGSALSRDEAVGCALEGSGPAFCAL